MRKPVKRRSWMWWLFAAVILGGCSNGDLPSCVVGCSLEVVQ